MNSTFSDRLQMFLQVTGLSPSRLAEKLGVQKSSISHLLSGRNRPSFDFLSKFARAFPDVNMHWLLTGEGAMFAGGEKKSSLPPPSGTESINTKPSNESETPLLFPELFEEEESSPTKKTEEVQSPTGMDAVEKKSEKKENLNKEKLASQANSEPELTEIIKVYSDGTFQVLKPFNTQG
ncbi:MAG: helix-turn-helix domain-containing protein [Chlorobi bacterium]|nr:helix-turn-helix domain-containing protein [Chlorobiota bacterium]